MNVEFTQFLGLGHGSGGNFNRWLDNSRFCYQQAVSNSLGGSIDELVISLFLPGPKGGFGAGDIDFKFVKKTRTVRASLRLDPDTYGTTTDASERIRLIISGLADLTVILGKRFDESQDWAKISARVYAIENEVFD